MRDIGHFIGGKTVQGTSGRHSDVFNPNTGEVQAKLAFASRGEVEQAIAFAQKAFPAWSATNPQRRARVLMKFLDLVQKEFDALSPRTRRSGPSTCRPCARIGSSGGRPTASRTTSTRTPTIASACTSAARMPTPR